MITRDTLQLLYQYGYSLTNQEATAFDLLHDALEHYLAQQTHPFHSVSSPESRIRQLMRQQFFDQIQTPQSAPAMNNNIIDLLDDLNSLEQLDIQDDILQTLWDNLVPAEREILYLWIIKGYTSPKIAEQIECSRGVLLTRAHHLRQKIASHIEMASKQRDAST